MTLRSLSALFLLVLLVACTFKLSSSGPSEGSVPSEPEAGGDEGLVDDTALSIDWTEVANAPLARFRGAECGSGRKALRLRRLHRQLRHPQVVPSRCLRPGQRHLDMPA